MVHITYTWKRQRIRHIVIDPARLGRPRMHQSDPFARCSARRIPEALDEDKAPSSELRYSEKISSSSVKARDPYCAQDDVVALPYPR